MNVPIRTALVSVSDKTGLAEFARGLARFKIKILSTGGTARLLAEHGIAVTEVADYTGFPEMLDGQVKTLHPRLHAGILARRDSRRRKPLSVRTDRGKARLHARAGDREYRRRRSEHAAGGGEELRRGRGRDRSLGLLKAARGDEGTRRVFERSHALFPGAKGVRPQRRVRRRDRQLPHRARQRRQTRRLPRAPYAPVRKSAGPTLRRKPASVGGTLPRRQSGSRRHRRPYPDSGKGAFLQQHRRCRRRVGMREDARRARLRDRQTRESLRRRGGSLARRSVRPRRLPRCPSNSSRS